MRPTAGWHSSSSSHFQFVCPTSLAIFMKRYVHTSMCMYILYGITFFNLLSVRSLFHGRLRSAFMARLCRVGIDTGWCPIAANSSSLSALPTLLTSSESCCVSLPPLVMLLCRPSSSLLLCFVRSLASSELTRAFVSLLSVSGYIHVHVCACMVENSFDFSFQLSLVMYVQYIHVHVCRCVGMCSCSFDL